jgi:glutathione S-transferase
MTPSLPILYTFRRCPYAMRARAALISLKIQCEVREIVLWQKPQELLKASSKGTVPVLILADGNVIEESLEIMLWALNHNDAQNLMSKDSTVQSKIRDLILKNDTEFKRALDGYKYPQKYPEQSLETWRDLGLNFLNQLESLLALSAHLFGQHATYGDLAILPFVRQFSRVDPAWFMASELPKLKTWLENWLNSELCAAVMQKYPLWTQGTLTTLIPSVCDFSREPKP